MSLELMVYFASVSDKMSFLCIMVGVIFILITMGALAHKLDGDGDSWLWFTGSLLISTILLAIGILIPSEKTIYTIAAIKMGKEISKNEKVIETTDKIYRLLNQELDKLIKEVPSTEPKK